jgi:HD superfamily phosphohydrolase
LEQLLAATGQTSQSTLLLKKRKEMREVDQSLENMKSLHKQRMDACEERRIQFEAKQAKMREQVLRFEKFIQENDAKRQRAESKAKQERKQYEDKLKEINALTAKMKSLEEEQQELLNLLVKNGRYKVFLERIVEEGELGYGEHSMIHVLYCPTKISCALLHCCTAARLYCCTVVLL